jgi:lysozyme
MTPQQRTATALAIATALAVPAEGLRQYAYYDPPGILSVCYGYTSAVVIGKKYSLDECKALLQKDMLDAIKTVDTCHKGLPIPVLAAFSDAVYNIGPSIACDPNKSTASRRLATGDFKGACTELPRWNRSTIGGVKVALPGLTKRRAAEQELCLTGVA